MRHIPWQIDYGAGRCIDHARSTPEAKVTSRNNVGFIFTRMYMRRRPAPRRDFLIDGDAGSARLSRRDCECHGVTEQLECDGHFVVACTERDAEPNDSYRLDCRGHDS
jgi:hypothetical protein